MTQPTGQPPILDLAPPKKSNNRFAIVILAGIFSTTLTLLIVYLIDRFADENVMGWYVDLIFPAGALLVGLAASTGYALASWLTGLKVRRQLLITIIAFQLIAYFVAHYIEFASSGPFVDKETGRVIGFWEFYHLSTVLMRWKETGQAAGNPLGNVGYLLRLGEITGFALGAIIAPAIMLKAAYCDVCERYMNRRELGVLPASTAKPGFFSRRKDNTILPSDAREAGVIELAEFTQLAGDGNAAAFIERMQPYRRNAKANKKLVQRILVQLKFCKQCHQGDMLASLLTGQGKKLRTTSLGKVPLTREFVTAILEPSKNIPVQ